MRNPISENFISCVINNRGGEVASLGRTARCDVCRKNISKNKPAVVCLEQSKVICEDCAGLYLKDISFLNYVEKMATQKIGSKGAVLELMEGSDLGRLAIIAHSDTYMLDKNYGSWRDERRVTLEKTGLVPFTLMIKSINYDRGDFLGGLIRLLSLRNFLKMMNNNPSLYKSLKNVLEGGDKELQLGFLKALPSMTWGRSEKLNLIGCLQNRNDSNVVEALSVSLKRLGIHDREDLRIALAYEPIVAQITEMYKADDLKQLHDFIHSFVPGAGEGKKPSDLAFDIVKQTAEINKIERLFFALPVPMQKLIRRLLWCRVPPDYVAVEYELDLTITRKKPNDGWRGDDCIELEKQYEGLLGLVSTDGVNIGLVVNSWLASRFTLILPKPEAANLVGREIPADMPYFSRIEYNPDFVALLPNLTSRLQQKMIPLKNNGLPSVVGCKKMEMFCGGYHEFYPEDKNLRNYRSEIIYRMFAQARISKEVELTAPVIAKALLDGLFKSYDVVEGYNFSYQYMSSNIVPSLLTHLEWRYSSETEAFAAEYLAAIKALMRAMPKGRWVTVEDALDYLFSNEIELGSTFAGKICSAIVENDWDSKTYARLDAATVTHYWEEPLLKTFFMMFAAVGALEIVCGPPVNLGKCVYGKEYLSRADGVLAVRLTPLGAWYFQGGDESCFKKIESGKIVPDKNRLLLHLCGNDITLKTTLEQTAKPVGGGFYSIDSGSFLDDCKSEEAVIQKINAFKALLPDELPQVWQNFFEKTLARLNPLKVVKTAYTVLELKDAPELKQHLLTNETLRKHVTLAEGGLILVAKKNIRPLKKKLAELGFYVDSF